MEIFYAVCAGITTVAVVVITYYLVGTLKQTRKTACEMEKLTKKAGEYMEITQDVLKTFNAIGESLSSVWLKGLKYLIAGVTGFTAVKQQFKTSKKESEIEIE
ncbi:MAG TPA: hypothetical protein VMW66_04970 [Elusimicrobiales bacterium]|nr:hypothetical protein [Elusimicrobiales bacterium]